MRPASVEGLVRERLGLRDRDMDGTFPTTKHIKNKVSAVKRRRKKDAQSNAGNEGDAE